MSIPNSVQRVLLALVGIPLVYLCLRQGGLLLLAAVDIIIICALIEFTTLLKQRGFKVNRAWTLAGALGISSDVHFSQGVHIPFILITAVIIILISHLFQRDRTHFIAHASLSVFGLFFIGFSISTILLIRQRPDGAGLAILLFCLVWICDTAAYVAGISMGRHRLWPEVSPRKTVEGCVAGLFGAWVTGLVARLIFMPGLSVFDAMAFGSIAGILGQTGDLVESALKRDLGAKDSSQLLPGHGGFLDRFDSLMFTAPAMYYYAYYFVHS